MGIITSFSFGDNFPPEYAIFPGIKLSYPFFVNFWSSVLWSPSESFQTLSLVFTFQWMVVWTFVYFLVDGKRNRLTPWAILLGGGCWYALGQNSGPMIEKGAPWAALISTTWVPQRTALCGLLPLLAVTTLSLKALQDLRESERLLCLAGLIAGISLLIHAHFIVAIVAIVGIAILLDSFWSAKEEESFESIVRVTARRLCFFHLPMLAGLVALPWLIGKTGVIEWRNGWMPFGWQSFWGHDGSVYERISASIAINRDQRGGVIDTLLMWSLNAPGWIALVAIGWVSLRRHATYVALFFVFVLGHLLHFAPWEWDQLKIFVALYVFSVVFASDLRGRARMLASVFLLANSVPAGYEVWKLMRERPMNTVYSLEEVQQSIAIREHTPPHAKIAAAPNHNSIVTLTGRRLWSGYDGTLWSHGLDYQSRRVILESLSGVSRCASTPQATEVGGCPEYLVWRDPEKSFWKTSTLPDAFLPVESVPFLKRVPARPPSEVP